MPVMYKTYSGIFCDFQSMHFGIFKIPRNQIQLASVNLKMVKALIFFVWIFQSSGTEISTSANGSLATANTFLIIKSNRIFIYTII